MWIRRKEPALWLCGRANGDAFRRGLGQPTRENRLSSESIWRAKVSANPVRTKRDTPWRENREGRDQIRMRRQRPHPLTHRAPRLPWGRSRLGHAPRVTDSAASHSGSLGVVRQPLITCRNGETKDVEIIKVPAKQP